MRTIDATYLDQWAASHPVSESTYIKPASDYADEVIEYFYGEKAGGSALPWTKAEGRFDLRPSEVTLWLGYNGHGKTLVLSQIALGQMCLGKKIVVASLEMKPAATMARMCRQASQGPKPDPEWISRFHKRTDGKLWIYDQDSRINPSRILNLVRYAREEIKADHIIVDSLMKVVPNEEDYGAIKAFVDGLCILARDTGIHIHLVHHSRKGMNEDTPPGKLDARGSGVITDLVDNTVSVWRRKNKQADTDSDCVLSIDKQRHGEWEGRIHLWFNQGSMQYVEGQNWPTKPYQL